MTESAAAQLVDYLAAAKAAGREVRFTALMHHISPQLLRDTQVLPIYERMVGSQPGIGVKAAIAFSKG